MDVIKYYLKEDLLVGGGDESLSTILILGLGGVIYHIITFQPSAVIPTT